jgi:tetratricopeptide (TPR) repeat protein
MTSFVSADGYPFDLGVENGGHRTISLLQFSSKSGTTGIADLNECQLWLARGLVWYFAFNHEEAIHCFKKALDIGDNPVMAHYFISASNGPNYNTETMNKDAFPSATEAFVHSRRAKELCEDPEIRRHLTSVEVDLVDALQCRFADPSTLKNAEGNPVTVEPIEQDTDGFADAMRKLYDKYPDDINVAALYAESLLSKSPWRLWDLNTGLPKEHTVVAQRVLETALAAAPNHPGLNHFFVHLMEMSPTPEASLPCCGVLRQYFPSAGHLIHMPSHIYVLLGMYREAAEANIAAWEVDEVYVKKEGIFNYYTGYRIHNMHFISYAAMFAGMVCGHSILQYRRCFLLRVPSAAWCLIEFCCFALREQDLLIDVHIQVASARRCVARRPSRTLCPTVCWPTP